MLQEGFLIISDITGYSMYLSKSELEHARDSLTDLLNILVEHSKSPLVISKLEGDAVFSYVKKGGILQSQTLLEIVENTYAAFRKALDLMIINTTCKCNACRNLPNLDLKFFIHYGQFSTQKISSYTELVGNSVNLIHRLLKNSVTEKLGISAYALYSQAAVDALPETSVFEFLPAHEENYPDVGRVQVVVQDLHAVWEKKKNEIRVIVSEEDAVNGFEYEFSVPPAILWEYLTKPEYRSIFLGSDYQVLSNQKQGRIDVDTVYTCAHGKNNIIQTIVDWEPFEQYSFLEQRPPGTTVLVTYRFTPCDTGTKMTMYSGKAKGNWLNKIVDQIFINYIAPKIIGSFFESLNQKIHQDLETGNTLVEQPIMIEPNMISAAAEDALELRE
ncbi:MAG TPA: DUF2652 domain-containing protein [Anaerolineales bacterium]|nr:DUF2652 domain-containing protein [Anaerolineales bacterium]